MAFRRTKELTHFNSHPHEEDDENLERDGAVDDISTHILTKRMTETDAPDGYRLLFQLTSSRRG